MTGRHISRTELSLKREDLSSKHTNEKEEAIHVNIWRDAQLPE